MNLSSCLCSECGSACLTCAESTAGTFQRYGKGYVKAWEQMELLLTSGSASDSEVSEQVFPA